MTGGRGRGLQGMHALLIGIAAVSASDREWWPLFVASAILAVGLSAELYRRDELTMRQVLLWALAYRAAWIWLPPVLSDDSFRYVWDGLLVASGINPYAWVPSADALAGFQGIEIYRHLNSAEFHSVYPPLSQWVFGFAAWVSGQDPAVTWRVVKGMVILAEIGAVLLLSKRVSPRALQLYAWHPVVLIAGAGQGHTEAIMLPLLVVAVLWERRTLASSALMLAGLVKLYPLFLLPWTWIRGRTRSVAVSLLVGAVVAAPFWAAGVLGNVSSSLDLYVRYFEFNAGPYYAVKAVFRWFTGEDWSKQIGPAFRLAFLVGVPVLYFVGYRLRWSLARLAIWLIGLMFLLSTTVHPWYLVGVLVLLPALDRPGWHWQWLAAWSIGTYLLYVGGPYAAFVAIGWIGFAFIAGYSKRQALINGMLELRARSKYRHMADWLPTGPDARVLDLGGGEGALARIIHRRLGSAVTVAEIRPVETGSIPLLLFDGNRVPLDDGSVDAVVLSFVLHHAHDADALLSEAVRVTRDRIIVLESTYRTDRERRLLERLDPLANYVRSDGQMDPRVQFRTGDAWRETFIAAGWRVIHEREWANPVHRKHLFVLQREA